MWLGACSLLTPALTKYIVSCEFASSQVDFCFGLKSVTKIAIVMNFIQEYSGKVDQETESIVK